MTDKIKRFIDCNFPVKTCNLRCHYCYITQNRDFEKELPVFKYTPRQMTNALSVKRLGGICVFNICGEGETLLPPEIISITKGLLEQGHYVNIITNGTFSKRIEEFLLFPKELLEKLFFKFSFHYLEFKRLNLLETFVCNVNKIKNAGCSISVEITPNDELIPYIEEIKEFSLKHFKALPHITVARNNKVKEMPILTNLSRSEYYETWKEFDSPMFEHKMEFFNQKRKEYCYAGDWTAFLLWGTGELRKCYKGETIDEDIFKDPNKKINWEATGHKCRQSHCFNSHAWLTFGAIPELKTITYEEIRNRACTDGTEWLNSKIKEVFKQKLCQNNKKYSTFKKNSIRIKKELRRIIK